jgi:Ni,Fe-hydrogenase III large subunit
MNRSENPPPSRGGKRMRELAGVYETTRIELEQNILSEIGRTPATLDRIAAEALSSAVIGARRKRAAGQHDSEQLKLVAQLMRASGLKPSPAKQAEEPVNPYAGLLLFDEETASAEQS